RPGAADWADRSDMRRHNNARSLNGTQKPKIQNSKNQEPNSKNQEPVRIGHWNLVLGIWFLALCLLHVTKTAAEWIEGAANLPCFLQIPVLSVIRARHWPG